MGSWPSNRVLVISCKLLSRQCLTPKINSNTTFMQYYTEIFLCVFFVSSLQGLWYCTLASTQTFPWWVSRRTANRHQAQPIKYRSVPAASHVVLLSRCLSWLVQRVAVKADRPVRSDMTCLYLRYHMSEGLSKIFHLRLILQKITYSTCKYSYKFNLYKRFAHGSLLWSLLKRVTLQTKRQK